MVIPARAQKTDILSLTVWCVRRPNCGNTPGTPASLKLFTNIVMNGWYGHQRKVLSDDGDEKRRGTGGQRRRRAFCVRNILAAGGHEVDDAEGMEAVKNDKKWKSGSSHYKTDYVLTPEGGLKKGLGRPDRKEDGLPVGPWDTLGSGSNEGEAPDSLPSGQMLLRAFVNGLQPYVTARPFHGITAAEAMVTDFSDYSLEDFWWPTWRGQKLDHDRSALSPPGGPAWEMIDSGLPTLVDILEGPNSIPTALLR